MSVTSNTGPIIALAKVDRLLLLKELYGEVHIPPAVHRELLAKIGPEAQRIDAALLDFVQVGPMPPLPPSVQLQTQGLGTGEQQAIALAVARGDLLLIDDRAGRTSAQQVGVKIAGIAGILIEAKRRGLLPMVRPMLEEIRRYGYWLSDTLVELAADLAGEPGECP